MCVFCVAHQSKPTILSFVHTGRANPYASQSVPRSLPEERVVRQNPVRTNQLQPRLFPHRPEQKALHPSLRCLSQCATALVAPAELPPYSQAANRTYKPRDSFLLHFRFLFEGPSQTLQTAQTARASTSIRRSTAYELSLLSRSRSC